MDEKFIGYFHLIDACEHPGCPLCRCLEEDSRRRLTTLLYEHVTDLETRRQLRASWGLCNWHTWMVLDAGGATGVAIIYEDLIGVCRRRVDHLRDRVPSAGIRFLTWLGGILGDMPRRVLPRLVQRYRERARCVVCAELRLGEATYIATMLDFADDPEFVRAYRRSSGLCLPHVMATVAHRPGASGIATILDRTLAQWETIRSDLERFVAKHEYRNAEPINADEADACRRAFEALAGRRGVFGTDLQRRQAPSPRIWGTFGGNATPGGR
jgi:hypothetical protein